MTAEERFAAETLTALKAQMDAAAARRMADGWRFMSSSITHRTVPKTAIVRWTRRRTQEDEG